MGQSIERQLGKIVAANTKMKNGMTIKETLEKAIDYLYDCMDNQILAYYATYTPKIYQRTFDFQDSLYAENFFEARVNGTRIELSVSFRDSMAYHRNLFDDHDSYVPALINFGWDAKKLEQGLGHPVYRLTYYEGFHMVERAIIQFNSQNPFGIHISPDDVVAIYDGKEVDKRYWLNNKRW